MKIIQSNHLKTLPDAIVCYDKQGKRIYVNSEWEKINQISADSVLNKTTNELPGIIEPDHDKIETIIKSGVSDEWDLKYKDDNGIHQYYSIRATPEYNHLGEINYVLTTARNITKFKLIEEKMNKQISSFFESPLTGMAILLPDKTWNKVNEKLCQILGYGYEEFHNTTWEHFTHPQDIDKDLKQFNKLFQGELFQCKFKKRFIHKNGSIIFADVALRCIRREDNSIDSILVLIEDVTDRVNAKNELQNFNNTLENRIEEKNSHYNSILKNSADIIYLVEVTKKGRFIHKDINEAYLKTTGLSREYLLNRYVDEFDIKEFKDILIEKYSLCCKAKKKVDYIGEYTFPKEIKIFHSILSPIFDKENNIYQIIGVARDITEIKEQEKLLRKKAKEYRSLAENLPDNIARWDTNGRYIYLNSTHMKTLGIQSADEVLGKKPHELHPQFIKGMQAINSIIQRKCDFATTLQQIFKEDGTIEFHDIKFIAEKNDENELTSILGIGRDITDMLNTQEKLKQKEQEINDSYSFFNKLVDSIPDPIFVKDKEHKWVVVNKSLSKLTGISKEEFIGKSDYDFFPKEEADIFWEKDEKVFQSGQVDINEEFITSNDGLKHHIETVKIKFNTDDKNQFIVGTIRDITKRKEQEKLLIKQEKKYRTLAQNADIPIYRYDKNFKRIFINSAVEKLVGKDASQFLEKTPLESGMIEPSYNDALMNSLKKVLRSKKQDSVELLFILPNGTKKYFIHNHVPEFDDKGNVESILVVGRDITAQKELALKEEKFRTLSENSPNIIMRYDHECNRIYANPAFTEQTGIPYDLTIGNKPETQWGVYLDMLNMTAIEFQKRVHKVIQTGISDNLTTEWIRKKDGTQVAHDIHLVAEKNEKGKIVGALAIGHEITKLKEANEQLLLQKFALDHIHDAIYFVNKDSSFSYVNTGACKELGYTKEELLQLCVDDIDPADWSPKNWDFHWQELKTKQNLTIETTHRRKDGTVFPVELNLSYTVYNAKEYNIAIARDITERKAQENALLQKEKEFRTLAEHTLDTIARYNKECKRTYVNPAFCKITGKTKEELLDKTPTFYTKTDSAKEYEKALKEVLQSGIESDFELIWKNANYETVTSLIHIVPEYDNNGEIESVLATGRDITKLKAFEKEILKQKDFQDTLLRGVAEADLGLHVIEDDKYIYTNNEKLTTQYYGELSVNDRPSFLDVIHPDDRERVMLIHQKRLAGEDVPTTYNINLVTQKGEEREHEVSVIMVPNTNPVRSILITKDITERKNIEKRIEFMAHHDILTALPNRLLAKDRAEQIFIKAKRLNKKAAVLFIDLDGFKTVNDSLGHSVGDEIIKKTASRLQSSIRGSDTIGRQGGDEFIMILPDLNDINESMQKAKKILSQFKLPFQVSGHTISLSASIGIAIYPDHGESFEMLLQSADAAMYKAKENGKNDCCIFTNKMKHNFLDMLNMQNDLKSAIKNQEFILHYQPQIDITENKIIGAETLIRWEHPSSGMILPMNFIPIAESSGFIVTIGEWILQEACSQAALWHKKGKKILVAVNISAIQFKRGNLLNTVKKALKVSGLEPQYLELELTESILIHDTDNVLQTVREIKELGVQLSIDDFGTGYSSLAYLKRFAVDKLKIDQSFVKDILNDKDDAVIVKTIIQMAKSFNLRSIAEGVEDKEVLDRIKEFGCDEVQGYHFAKPMKSNEFENFYNQFI